MSEGSPTGTPVAGEEDLYRCLMQQKWWNEEENRVSSAAFTFRYFSANMASLASEEQTLAPFLPGTGLVVFACRDALEIGCDVRKEADPIAPDNEAHAHVYMPPKNTERKRAAQRLIKACRLIRKPNFSP